jgi:methylmalonyl-CoA/ethylmalonyl-CoA epimerase
MSEKPVFKGVSHVSVVVKNLDEAMKKYWEGYGIGPWDIYTFDPSNVSDMTVRNQRVDHAMRLAMADVGGFQWELIEPLDEKSVYGEFLKEHGEGLHHVAFAVDDYDEALAFFQARGIGVLQGGRPRPGHGVPYVYIDSQDTLSCIAEICDVPEGYESPPPEATYP